MPEPKRPLKVFLCHAHADRDAVRTLYTRLTNDGVDAWLDKEKLLPGQDWELEIRKAVREADVVVVCLSKQFNQAGFRQKEVRLALDTAMEKPEGEIFIIPARLEECENLESLRKWHWVDLYEDDGYEKFLRALYSRGERIGAITYSLRKSDLIAEKARKIAFLRLQAERMEANEEWGSALDLYRQLERLDESAVDGRKIATLLQKIQRGSSAAASDTSRDLPSIKKNPAWMTVFAAAVSIACCLSIFAAGGWYLWKASNPPFVTPTFVSETPTLESTILLPSQPVETSIVDGMALVRAGEFSMGSDQGDSDELPIHVVYLDAYLMDLYEVTNGAYNECVKANVCQPTSDQNRKDLSDPEIVNYPVVHVDWNMAKAYCEWRGAYLPTEAQWEKAARGTDQRTYPWGETASCDFANYADCINATVRVGSYPKGGSPYGLFDMGGNVFEWVADYYSSDYYDRSPKENPTGPAAGDLRVMRGGGYGYPVDYIRTTVRYGQKESLTEYSLGFRCAMDAP